jgi:hypothetical protein
MDTTTQQTLSMPDATTLHGPRITGHDSPGRVLSSAPHPRMDAALKPVIACAQAGRLHGGTQRHIRRARVDALRSLGQSEC